MNNNKVNNRLVIVKMEENLLVLSLYINGLFVKEAAAPWDAIPNQKSLQKLLTFSEKRVNIKAWINKTGEDNEEAKTF